MSLLMAQHYCHPINPIRHSIAMSHSIVAILLLLKATFAEAEITTKAYKICREIKQHVFHIVAGQCTNGDAPRVLTGFFYTTRVRCLQVPSPLPKHQKRG